MTQFNVDDELVKFKNIANSDVIDECPFYDYYSSIIMDNRNDFENKYSKRSSYLFYILQMTVICPQVEIYLEELLKNYTIDELDTFWQNQSILYHMVNNVNISVNSWKMIVNHGINVNELDEYGDTVLHKMVYGTLNFEIMKLLIINGLNLNVQNINGMTVLDNISLRGNAFGDIIKHIMLLIDSGAKTNNPIESKALEFIENYSSESIKVATKK